VLFEYVVVQSNVLAGTVGHPLMGWWGGMLRAKRGLDTVQSVTKLTRADDLHPEEL
jgi:hypothetical protein